MKPYTPWGVKVRTRLLASGKSISQLADEASEMTGMYVDSQYLYKIFTGERNPQKIIDAVDEILELV